LDQFREAVKNKDSVGLMATLERAQEARRNYRHAADDDS